MLGNNLEEKIDLIEERKKNDKKAIIEQLKKLPIVQVACQKAGVGRATYYRWRNEDKDFALASDKAVEEGVAIINDLSESQLISAIKNNNFSAVRFWLQSRHKAYTNKVEVSGKVMSIERELNEEQKKVVERALRLASLDTKKYDN